MAVSVSGKTGYVGLVDKFVQKPAQQKLVAKLVLRLWFGRQSWAMAPQVCSRKWWLKAWHFHYQNQDTYRNLEWITTVHQPKNKEKINAPFGKQVPQADFKRPVFVYSLFESHSLRWGTNFEMGSFDTEFSIWLGLFVHEDQNCFEKLSSNVEPKTWPKEGHLSRYPEKTLPFHEIVVG